MSLVTQITAAFQAVGSALKSTNAAVALKAPTASPTFTGTVSGVTAAMVGAIPNSDGITHVKQMTASAYSALATKDSSTLYVIVG